MFATLNPLLADGHLFVGIPNWRAEAEAHLAQGGTFFPVEVYVSDDGSVLVKAALGGGETPHAGARLQSINGVDARVVSAELLARAHGDTPAFRAELVSRRWWFYYWKVYGAKVDFDLDFSGGQPASVRVPGSREKPEFLAEEADFGRQFGIELLRCRGALLTVKSFSWKDKAQFIAFTRDAFGRIRDAGVQTLVIDVRANGGGDDDYWIEGILPYVATKPYRWASTYRKRVLEEYRDEGETTGDVVSGEIDRWIQPEPAKSAALFRQGLRADRPLDVFVRDSLQQCRAGLRVRRRRRHRRQRTGEPERRRSENDAAEHGPCRLLAAIHPRTAFGSGGTGVRDA